MLLLSVSIAKRTHKHLQPRSTPSWLIGKHIAMQYTLRISMLWTTPNHISLPVRVVKILRAWICCHQALILLLEDQRKGGFVVQLRGKVAISGLSLQSLQTSWALGLQVQATYLDYVFNRELEAFVMQVVRAILVISILTRAKYANLATFRAI